MGVGEWMTSEMDGWEESVVETTHDTGWARAWLRESMPGRRIGCDVGLATMVGVDESRVEGNARDEI